MPSRLQNQGNNHELLKKLLMKNAKSELGLL